MNEMHLWNYKLEETKLRVLLFDLSGVKENF